ncbi:MAG: hypothetical protein PHC75_02600 [Burkholderiales bacterium]|nr:hypothetical protein [Burkholderiales bacterium]
MTHLHVNNLSILGGNTNFFVSGKLYINGSPMKGDFGLAQYNLGSHNFWAWSSRNDQPNYLLTDICKDHQNFCYNGSRGIETQVITPNLAFFAISHSSLWVDGMANISAGQYPYVPVSTEDGGEYILYPVYDTHSLMVAKIN